MFLVDPKILAWTQNEHSWTRVRYRNLDENYKSSRDFYGFEHFQSQQIGITYDNCDNRWVTSTNNGSLMSIGKNNKLLIGKLPKVTFVSYDDENKQFYWTSKGIIGIGVPSKNNVQDIWKTLITDHIQIPTSIIVHEK